MALTAAQIQTKITNLNATYNTLSTKLSKTLKMGDRETVMRDLEEVQTQLTFWEGRLARANGSRPRVMTQDLRNAGDS